MTAGGRKDEAALDRLLGLGDGPVAGSELEALRRPPRMEPARRAAAWEAIQRRLAAGEGTAPLRQDEIDADLPPGPAGVVAPFRARTRLFAAAAGLLLTVGLAVWFLGREEPGAPSGVALPGVVIAVQGQVTRAGLALKKGDLLQPGDEVRTGPAGRLDFVVDDRNVFRLLASARMIYEVRTGGARLDIRRGYLAAVIRKRERLGALELVTGPVVSRVTGTVLFVGTPTVHDGEATGYVCICHGRVEVFDRRGGQANGPREREALHHYAGIFARAADGTVRELPGDMRFHDDALLEGLAELVGERIDWSAPEPRVNPR